MIRMKKRTILATLLLTATTALTQSHWIIPPNTTSTSVGIYEFRKEITLPDAPRTLPIHVTADNRFILYINGTRMGDGPALADPQHWRYATYDIASHLHKGKNILASTVWSFGEASGWFQFSLRPAFALWTDTPSPLTTDNTWQVRTESAWTIDPKAAKVGPGFILNAAANDWAWNQPKDRATWSPAEPLPNPGWTLQPDTLPAMESTPTQPGKIVRTTTSTHFPEQSLTIPAHTKTTLLLDRATLTTAFPSLTVSKGRASRITLTYAEALYDAKHEKGNRSDITNKTMDLTLTHDVFLPDGSPNRTFTPLWWRTWRYLQLDIETGDQPLRLDSLTAAFTAYPFTEKATFQSSDPELAKIWDVGYRTLRLDAHETYMDCPYWEELQYIGDTRIESLISYVVTGDDRLAQQALRAFAATSLPSGLTQSRGPARQYQLIPPFSLLWIGMIHDFWQYRPDNGLVAELLPKTRAVLDFFSSQQRPDGLFVYNDKPGYFDHWNFVDWAPAYKKGVPPQDPDGGSTVLSLQFIAALRDAADLEQNFGDPARATAYRAQANTIAATVYRKTWDATAGMLAETPAHQVYSQQANIMGVLLDVIPPAGQQKVMKTILADELSGKPLYPPDSYPIRASYYFRFYLARALDHAHMDDLYLNLLGPWHEMLDMGLSTWAENPEPARSDAHAWSSHPNYDLITLVAGIRPASPGFHTVDIAPHLGNLKDLTVSIPIPTGTIKVSYKKHTNGMDTTIELPEGTTGTFHYEGMDTPLHAGAQHMDTFINPF
jgi:hypothetical protein